MYIAILSSWLKFVRRGLARSLSLRAFRPVLRVHADAYGKAVCNKSRDRFARENRTMGVQRKYNGRNVASEYSPLEQRSIVEPKRDLGGVEHLVQTNFPIPCRLVTCISFTPRFSFFLCVCVLLLFFFSNSFVSSTAFFRASPRLTKTYIAIWSWQFSLQRDLNSHGLVLCTRLLARSPVLLCSRYRL